MSAEENNQLVLIAGKSGVGKSFSAKNIREQNAWFHINSEAGKRLPFKNDFFSVRLKNPLQALEVFDYAIANQDKVKGIFLDSITMLMDMFETQYIYNSQNKRQGWADYQQFFKTLIQTKVVQFDRPVVVTAHTQTRMSESGIGTETTVPIKGALAGRGVEAYFSTIVAAKTLPLEQVEPYFDNGLLTLTPEEEAVGIKHVFQTKMNKDSVGESIKSPHQMFSMDQVYMDNDIQLLLDHLNAFYNS